MRGGRVAVGRSGYVITRSNNPAITVGTDLTKIVTKMGDSRGCSVYCNTMGKVLNVLGRGCLGLSSVFTSSTGLRGLGAAPTVCLNSYHRGLPSCGSSSSPCMCVFRRFSGLSVGTFFCVNKGSSVSAMLGLSSCTGGVGDSIGVVKVPGAVSGSLYVASRAPNFNSTTGCVTSDVLRVTRSAFVCTIGDIAVIRVVKHSTK